MRDYNFRVVGNSFRKEFVFCNNCGKSFVWLKAVQLGSGFFICECAKCGKLIEDCYGK